MVLFVLPAKERMELILVLLATLSYLPMFTLMATVQGHCDENCPRGTYCSGQACPDCKSGEYQDKDAHTETDCKPHQTEVPNGLHWKKEPIHIGNRFQDYEWGCEDGYIKTSPHLGFKKDTFCILNETSTVQTTPPSSNTTIIPTNEMSSLSTSTLKLQEDGLSGWEIVGIVVGVIVGIVLVVIVVIVLVLYFKRRRNQTPSDTEEEETFFRGRSLCNGNKNQAVKDSKRSTSDDDDLNDANNRAKNGEDMELQDDGKSNSSGDTRADIDSQSSTPDDNHPTETNERVRDEDVVVEQQAVGKIKSSGDNHSNELNSKGDKHSNEFKNGCGEEQKVGFGNKPDAVTGMFNFLKVSLDVIELRSLCKSLFKFCLIRKQDLKELENIWKESFKDSNDPVENVDDLKEMRKKYPQIPEQEFNTQIDLLYEYYHLKRKERNYLTLVDIILFDIGKRGLWDLFKLCAMKLPADFNCDCDRDAFVRVLHEYTEHEEKDILVPLEKNGKENYPWCFETRILKKELRNVRGQSVKVIGMADGEIKDEQLAFKLFRSIIKGIRSGFLLELEVKESLKNHFSMNHEMRIERESCPQGTVPDYAQCGLKWFKSHPGWDHRKHIDKCIKEHDGKFLFDDEEFKSLWGESFCKCRGGPNGCNEETAVKRPVTEETAVKRPVTEETAVKRPVTE